MQVTNEAIRDYWDACEALARPYVGRAGAELDDLQQEGLIFVWQSLARGIAPSAVMIENRMKDYLRWIGRQVPVDYETMLPLDDYRQLAGEAELPS